MKYLICIFLPLLFQASTQPDCLFSTITYTQFDTTGKEVASRTIEGCFQRVMEDERLQYVVITDPKEKVRIYYYLNDDPTKMEHLVARIGNAEPQRWKAKENNTIYAEYFSDRMVLHASKNKECTTIILFK